MSGRLLTRYVLLALVTWNAAAVAVPQPSLDLLQRSVVLPHAASSSNVEMESEWRSVLSAGGEQTRALAEASAFGSYSYSYDVSPEESASCKDYELLMFDAWGDGWNGQRLSITNFVTGESVYSNLGKTFTGGAEASATVCLALDTCFRVSVSSGSYDSDVSWSLNGVAGVVGTFDMCTDAPSTCTFEMLSQTTVAADGSHALECALANLTHTLTRENERGMTVVLVGDGPYVRTASHVVTRSLDLALVGDDVARPVVTASGGASVFVVERGATLSLQGEMCGERCGEAVVVVRAKRVRCTSRCGMRGARRVDACGGAGGAVPRGWGVVCVWGGRARAESA